MPRRAAGPAIFAIIVLIAVAACSASGAPTLPPSTGPASLSPSPAAVETAQPTASTAPETPTPAATESPAPTRSHKPLPSIDQSELDAYLTASITLIDLADDDLAVDVAYVDPSSDESLTLGTYALSPNEQMTNQVPPGTYRLLFHLPAGSKTSSTCTIEMTDTDGYIFAAVPGSVAITRTGAKPKTAGDLFVAASSLCRK